jgi:hypothetical protein
MQVVPYWYRMQAFPAVARAGIVVGGYAAAILLALGVVSLYIDQTSGFDRDASSGMFGFADALVFIAVFGVVSIIPTGLALVFLRQSRGFWVALSVVALVVASTSLAEVAATVLAPQSSNPWAMLAFPRIFLSPFLAAAFGLSALVAPGTRFRWYLWGAAGIEGVSSIYGFFHWFAPLLFH